MAGYVPLRRALTHALIGAAMLIALCVAGAFLTAGGPELSALGWLVVVVVVGGALACAAAAVAELRGRPAGARRALLVAAVVLLPTVVPPLLAVVARLLIDPGPGGGTGAREVRTPVSLPPGYADRD